MSEWKPHAFSYHVPAINAELQNILNIFDYKKEIIRKDEIIN